MKEELSARDSGSPKGRSSRVRRPTGIILSRFPLITETFILREIDELERNGQPVVLIPMIEEHPDVVHAEAYKWVRRAVTVPFFSVDVVTSFLKMWMKKPRTMFRILNWMVGKSLLHPRELLKSLALFPKSVYLAEWIQGTEIRHVHAHFATHPTTIARIISLLTGVTYSFTVHAHDIFVNRSLLREKIRDARFIRSISKFNKGFLENLYPREASGKIEVVHVGIEPERYERSPDQGQRDDGSLRILCIAAMKPYKGIPFLIEAVRELRDSGIDVALEIIGTGPMMHRIAGSIRANGLDSLVTLAGALPQDEVAARIRDADVFVLPSIVAVDGQMEGIPVALMEAMAAGKPVISTSISGIPELIEHERSGLLVDPANPSQLALAIRRLIEDPDLRKNLGIEARAKVEREFDLEQVGEQLVSLLDDHNPPLEGMPVLPDIGDQVEWGLREIDTRRDSRIFEMIVSSDHRAREIIMKEHLDREGQSRGPLERAGDEREILRSLAPHFRGAVAGGFELAIPEIEGFDAGSGVIAMEKAGDRTMEDSIRAARGGGEEEAEWLSASMEATGAWLAHFQRYETGPMREALARTANEARRMAENLSGKRLSRARAGRIVARVDELERELASDLAGSSSVAHHGDFWPGNVFHDGKTITVIDFEGYGLSLPSRDRIWFLLHTSFYFRYRAPSLLELCRQSFARGYAGEVNGSEEELSRIHASLLLLNGVSLAPSLPLGLLRMIDLRRELAV